MDLRQRPFCGALAPVCSPHRASALLTPGRRFSDDRRTIPGFVVNGGPQILSDRIILTPPAPGGQRAALWSSNTNPYVDWSMKVDFRAAGGERPGGSFYMWYTSQPKGTESVYTSKPWDGLALVVDGYGGGAGSIRGYLNDGTTDYSIHHDPASLAFGHCGFNYRNKGSLSTILLTHTNAGGIRVEVDGQPCFSTPKVRDLVYVDESLTCDRCAYQKVTILAPLPHPPGTVPTVLSFSRY